jgi:hypothetical protein
MKCSRLWGFREPHDFFLARNYMLVYIWSTLILWIERKFYRLDNFLSLQYNSFPSAIVCYTRWWSMFASHRTASWWSRGLEDLEAQFIIKIQVMRQFVVLTIIPVFRDVASYLYNFYPPNICIPAVQLLLLLRSSVSCVTYPVSKPAGSVGQPEVGI